MIQRIQSVYLGLAIVAQLLLLFIPAWKTADGTSSFMVQIQGFAVEVTSNAEGVTHTETVDGSQFFTLYLYMGFFVLAILSAGFSIFMYGNRTRQLKFVRGAIVIHLVEILCLVFSVNRIQEFADKAFDISYQSPLIGFFLPAIAMVLCYLAQKAIKKDEELIRSMDRIR